jgi:hypothetical protein
MKERDGVRSGMQVESVNGEKLGRVVRLYDWGFAVQKGFPILFRRDRVLRYDEVRGVRDGVLVVARGENDLLELAAGEIPRSWRVPTPHGFPSAATPSEARGLQAVVASWPLAGVRPGTAAATPAATTRAATGPCEAQQARDATASSGPELSAAEETRYVSSRGQATRGASLIWQREDADRHA